MNSKTRTKYADPQCVLLWLKVLEHGTISKIDNILPVITKQERDSGLAKGKPQQNGGLRCKFQGTSDDMEIKVKSRKYKRSELNLYFPCLGLLETLQI